MQFRKKNALKNTKIQQHKQNPNANLFVEDQTLCCSRLCKNAILITCVYLQHWDNNQFKSFTSAAVFSRTHILNFTPYLPPTSKIFPLYVTYCYFAKSQIT